MQIHEPPFNPELMKILNDFVLWFYAIDRTKIQVDGAPDKTEEYTSIQWLEESKKIPIDQKGGEGFPKKVHGIDLMRAQAPAEYLKRFTDIAAELNNWTGSKYCAVQMYYPCNGYMDWHNNGNASGYNILMSYSRFGKGWFRWQDPLTGEIHTEHDNPGWNIKTGYYGRHDEPDKLIWHCARTYQSSRLTFGYVIPNRDMWESMIEDILDV